MSVAVGAGRIRERLADRPRRILDEAIGIIGQRGYYGFSIKELAERCGLTVAGVLHHFGSKDRLLIALLKDRDERDAEAVWRRAPAEAAPAPMGPEDVRRLFHDAVVRNSGQPEIVRLYSMLRTESLYPEHPAHGFFRARDAAALEMFERLVAPHVAEPQSTARQLLALMGGLEELWLRDLERFDLVAEWDLAIAALMRPAPAPVG
ncbi:MAG: TetR/AcrR family transcriptional regulator [Sphingomonadales bacterium]|nr:TetR/AcrR family transcriptional regulator [Sphingomonadales bacterium]